MDTFVIKNFTVKPYQSSPLSKHICNHVCMHAHKYSQGLFVSASISAYIWISWAHFFFVGSKFFWFFCFCLCFFFHSFVHSFVMISWKIKGIINPSEHVHMNSSCLSCTLYVRRNILVSQWLKPSNVLVVIACISAQFPVVELDFADWFSIASDPFGCQVSCRISTEWDCQLKYSLAKTVKLEVLACSFHTNFNYVTSLE